MVRTVRPNASATPTNPIPSCGKAAASTALPQPPNTSQAVPRNSALSFFPISDSYPCSPASLLRRENATFHWIMVLRLQGHAGAHSALRLGGYEVVPVSRERADG